MALLEVLTYPNPILKKKGQTVKKITPELLKLAQDMLETMYAAPGVGLAAVQVGALHRLIVIDTRPRDDDDKVVETRMTDLERKISYPLIMFNPEVVKKEGETSFEEGCLSVPGYTELVRRPELVNVRYMDEYGEQKEFTVDGLLAICIQHEIDHLDGKLFLDRLTTIRRNLIKAKIKKNGYSEDDDDEPRSAL